MKADGNPMIACVWLPGFALRVLAHRRSSLARAVATHSTLETHPVILECSEAATRAGVEPGMLVSRAMGACSDLRLLEYDGARVGEAYEQFLQRLESIGAAVEPVGAGRALFDAGQLERLYGGLQGVVDQVVQAFRSDQVRVGLARSRFPAEIAARLAEPGSSRTIEPGETRRTLAKLPLEALPVDARTLEVWHALGWSTLDDVARVERAQITDRFGSEGVRLWELARGVDESTVTPRRLQKVVEEKLEFPEAIGDSITLTRAVTMLVERALVTPLFASYAPRDVTVVARLVTGGSWQSVRRLRVPTVEPDKIVITAVAELEQIPAPVERLSVRFERFSLRDAEQASLLQRRGDERARRAREGIRHIQATLDDEAVLAVLDIAPHSRIPEHRSVLVPVDTGDVA